jgi:hypothetical protein
MKTFNEFQIEEKLNPKKQYTISNTVQDSIKKLCESVIHEEAKACHEDETNRTYDSYVKECGSYMNECMNECMSDYIKTTGSN